jgi:hypothetical protein
MGGSVEGGARDPPYAESTMHEGHATRKQQGRGSNTMTHSKILVLVAVFVSIFTFAPISPVSACELNASDQCVQMAATDHAAQFLLAIAPSSYLLSREADAATTAISPANP